VVALVAVVAVVTACGGGSSDGDPVAPGGGISAGFLPDETNPGADTVSAGEGGTGGNLVTVDINVTDTNGIYGAAFDLGYDPSLATWLDFTEGNLLEQGGNTPFYDVQEPQAGQLVVVATRQGDVPGADASGTRTIIGLTFEVIDVIAGGGSVISFSANTLVDDQPQPQPIPGIGWSAGRLTGTD